MPTKRRGLPAVAVEREGELLLFDCGEGTQRQMMNSRLGRMQPSKIFVSHAHGDHVLGLFGLLMTLGMSDRKAPVKVFGPAEVGDMVEDVLGGAGLPFELLFERVTGGRVVKEKGYIVRAQRSDHHGESYAYRLDEAKRPGRFNPDRAKELGVPEGPLWHRLQEGKAVRFHGREVRPGSVVGPWRMGRSFGYSGDTRPSGRLQRFFRGVDLLVFESTYTSEYQDEAEEYGHSTAAEAGRLAARAGVGRLVLTHFSPRVPDAGLAVKEASRYHADVSAGNDFESFDLPLHD
ncbi:MAG: ribonuclease Z [Nitrososphaerota archaeon]|nr:ribonuclease Z [Nitrososphaerota archaeon]MDG6939424.1 ribonuclease Z [Nitrososphaerota archaeon]